MYSYRTNCSPLLQTVCKYTKNRYIWSAIHGIPGDRFPPYYRQDLWAFISSLHLGTRHILAISQPCAKCTFRTSYTSNTKSNKRVSHLLNSHQYRPFDVRKVSQCKHNTDLLTYTLEARSGCAPTVAKKFKINNVFLFSNIELKSYNEEKHAKELVVEEISQLLMTRRLGVINLLRLHKMKILTIHLISMILISLLRNAKIIIQDVGWFTKKKTEKNE